MRMRKTHSILLGLALSLSLGLMTACGSDSTPGGISVGAIAPATSGAGIVTDAAATCSGTCDGNLADVEFRGFADNDIYALVDMLFWNFWWALNPGNVTGSSTYTDIIDGIPDGVERDLTFTANRTTNCNSTGTTEPDLGDASGGTITERFSWTSTFDNAGQVAGSDDHYHWWVAFNNCLLEGDMLNNGGLDEAIRLNGGWHIDFFDPDAPTDEDPEFIRSLGRVNMSTDANADDTFGNEFWNRFLDINAESVWGDTISTVDGGACAGEVVEFGGDDTVDTDDACADDGDLEADDGFIDADWLHD